MTAPESILRPVPGLVVEWFEDAILVWDESVQKLHHLDPLAATVWSELDGRHLADIAAALAAEFGVSDDVVRRDLLTLGDTLLTQGLVQLADA